MPGLFVAAFLLWTTLGSRMILLRRGPRGTLRSLVHRRADGRSVGGGIVGEAVALGVDLWLEHERRPVPRGFLDEALGELEASLSSGALLSRCLVAMAPLLGLLGTVSGLIETFGSLGTSSSSTASEGIAGGIVEALYATQMGLAIAVPGLLATGVLHHREERLATELSELKELLAGALGSGEAE